MIINQKGISMILTKNEKHVLRFLATSLGKDYSINEVARICGISPNGAHKLLTKLEMEGMLKLKPIANIKAYRPDFENEKTTRLIELAFIHDILQGRIQARARDLAPLKTTTKACILFGSYMTAKEKPGDLDILVILDRKDFAAYKRTLANLQEIVPIKIQDIIQTIDDLQQNLKKNDPIITEALRNGIILWGFDILTQVIKRASR